MREEAQTMGRHRRSVSCQDRAAEAVVVVAIAVAVIAVVLALVGHGWEHQR
ncbi:hypothetical protein ACQP1G_37885 [Nocardia sp. CA-107356]|uniref:hypothetical protein n=1 Tax=Nocardia sp. CA-107356 TaxID=3239972 RepID=UPI003D8FD891